jgi:hypothetical protein
MTEKRNCRDMKKASDDGRIWVVTRVLYACNSSMKIACGDAGYGDERRCIMMVMLRHDGSG